VLQVASKYFNQTLKVMFFQQSMYQLYFEALATKKILEWFALENESLDKKQRNGIESHVFLAIYVSIILWNISD
jgi:aromatic ring-cleaving dioxygenase